KALLPRLKEVAARGAAPPSPAEAVELARLCLAPFQKRYLLAVRLSGEAFRSDPSLEADLVAGHRYNAACSAALAATGPGSDTSDLALDEHLALSRQARAWLRAYLQ